MTEHKTYCDHCGKQLDRMTDHDEVEIEANHKWMTVDLCEPCFDELWSMIEKFCGEEIEDA